MKNDMSRRQVLKSGAALLPSVPALAVGRPILAYVGTYSSPQGPEGSKGNGKGIYLFRMDASTGALTNRELFEDPLNPSWLALHPSGKYLYAANEVPDFEGARSGAVTAYGVDRTSGRLKRINTVSSQGAGPAHLSVHPSGNYVFVANYFGGTFAVLPVASDGKLRAASDVKHEIDPVGPLHAASAPEGSFAISGRDRPHAHMIEPDPAGAFVLGTDLGTDRIKIWKFDSEAGKLDPNRTKSVPVPAATVLVILPFIPMGVGCIPCRRKDQPSFSLTMTQRTAN
jgi:6-phosphogluconolactonase